MKKRLLIMTAALMSVAGSISANCGSAALRVDLPIGSRYELIVDGYRSFVFGGSVNFNDLRPGRHSLTIIRLQDGRGCGHRHRGHRDCGNRQGAFTYSTQLRLRSGSFLIASMDPFGRVAYFENRPGTYGFYSNEVDFDDGFCNNASLAMDEADFYGFLSTLRNRPFEDTRLELVRSAVTVNQFTIDQVRSLMEEFNFESNRLEVAKLAYDSTIDKERYFMLYDALTFDSSVNELSRFIDLKS